jgi:ligand-binding sensor protein
MPDNLKYDYDAHLEIEDLVEVESLRELFSAFHAATNIAASIISLNGRIVAGVGWRRVCTMYHRRMPDSEQLCIENNADMTRELRQNHRETIRRCPHGLMVAAVPILIYDQYIATIRSGGFLTQPLDTEILERFRAHAARFGFEERDYLTALSSVPIIAETHVPYILQFLKRLAELVGE